MLATMVLACNNQADKSNGSGNDSTGNTKKEELASGTPMGNCGNSLLFRKGAEIQTSSYDGQGKETAKQVSSLTKVYNEGNMTIAEWEVKNINKNNGVERTMNTIYKCDGKLLYTSVSGFLPDTKQNSNIETGGLPFPLNVSVGETLPDAEYSVNITSGDMSRKITSHIKDRKVESKESVTTAAGTFECYKISSVIETETAMPDMDEESKKIMEQVKKKMGKNKMTFWYVPDVTVIKMEYYMGDKLITRTEVTSIKK